MLNRLKYLPIPIVLLLSSCHQRRETANDVYYGQLPNPPSHGEVIEPDMAKPQAN
jgi:hypothetical protein